MGKQAQNENLDENLDAKDDPKASQKDLNAAFIGGHEGKENDWYAKDEDQDLIIAEEIDRDPKASQTLSLKKNKKDDKDIDEWAGVSSAVRARLEKMEASVAQANNAASSASGRASKLQAELDKRLAANKPKPRPTSEQITEALGNPEKLKELEEQWPDMVAGINEGLNSMSIAVGGQIDKATSAMRKEWSEMQQKSQDDLLNRLKVDNAHPNWENTISSNDFKTWFYEGGPSNQESMEYEQAVANASNSLNTPQQSAEFSKRAGDTYSRLLTSYPDWAAKKGNLYGSPSSDAAIKLLDMHKGSFVNEDEAKIEKDSKKKRLSDNIAPTTGKGVKAPADNVEDVNEAFLSGFKSSSY